jgi:hypothetical protein
VKFSNLFLKKKAISDPKSLFLFDLSLRRAPSIICFEKSAPYGRVVTIFRKTSASPVVFPVFAW